MFTRSTCASKNVPTNALVHIVLMLLFIFCVKHKVILLFALWAHFLWQMEAIIRTVFDWLISLACVPKKFVSTPECCQEFSKYVFPFLLELLFCHAQNHAKIFFRIKVYYHSYGEKFFIICKDPFPIVSKRNSV